MTEAELVRSLDLQDGKHHILLAASGSVATIKLPLIARALAEHENVSVKVLITHNADAFLQGQSKEQPTLTSLLEIPRVDGIYRDEHEWVKPWVRGDKILHIELRRWAHLLVIAPLSANTLAKMAHGISDNLLTSVLRAWDLTGMIDGRKKFIMLAPAMNTAMWRHPITRKQLKTVQQDYSDEDQSAVILLRPMEKELACGDVGDGAMMAWTSIVAEVAGHLNLKSMENGTN